MEKLLALLEVGRGFAELLGVTDLKRRSWKYETSRLNRAHAGLRASIAARQSVVSPPETIRTVPEEESSRSTWCSTLWIAATRWLACAVPGQLWSAEAVPRVRSGAQGIRCRRRNASAASPARASIARGFGRSATPSNRLIIKSRRKASPIYGAAQWNAIPVSA